MQVIPIQINLKQLKLIVSSIYRPPDQEKEYFLSSITNLPDYYLKTYQDFILMGDFNKIESSPALDSFLANKSVKAL